MHTLNLAPYHPSKDDLQGAGDYDAPRGKDNVWLVVRAAVKVQSKENEDWKVIKKLFHVDARFNEGQMVKEMTLRFDFHCHSTASDGALSPTELVARAAGAGVEYLALTDHDTLAGWPEAHKAAVDLGVQLIPGIEISVQWESRELHIVGLAFDPAHPAIVELVAYQQEARVNRAKKMGERLDKAACMTDAYRKASELSGQVAPGRPWFAQILVAEGKARNDQHAFNRFLKPGQSAFVKTPWLTVEQAVSALTEAGGVAVLAHPTRYGLTRKKLRTVLKDFTAAGGRGLESLTVGLNPNQKMLVEECLRDFDMLASGGSDFHTPRQTWLELGKVPPLSEMHTPVWQAFPAAYQPVATS